MGLAMPWWELVPAVAAMARWPRACALPALASLQECPGQGAGTPTQSLQGEHSPARVMVLPEGRLRRGRRKEQPVSNLKKTQKSSL